MYDSWWNPRPPESSDVLFRDASTLNRPLVQKRMNKMQNTYSVFNLKVSEGPRIFRNKINEDVSVHLVLQFRPNPHLLSKYNEGLNFGVS